MLKVRSFPHLKPRIDRSAMHPQGFTTQHNAAHNSVLCPGNMDMDSMDMDKLKAASCALRRRLRGGTDTELSRTAPDSHGRDCGPRDYQGSPISAVSPDACLADD